MKQLVIAFDVDDTLIIPSVVTGNRDIPNYETIAVYRWFQAQGCHMIIWSGSGVDWAQAWADKLGLQPDEIRPKTLPASICSAHQTKDLNCEVCSSSDIDIVFDDCDVKLGKVNVRVGRVANNISREIWNKTKRPN